MYRPLHCVAPLPVQGSRQVQMTDSYLKGSPSPMGLPFVALFKGRPTTQQSWHLSYTTIVGMTRDLSRKSSFHFLEVKPPRQLFTKECSDELR